ncbi:MAG: hypothetical protein MJ007_03055 [Paludibacteraceae bacterium]|nr:hypothetical protein [Paludibacteraceae bacterium]
MKRLNIHKRLFLLLLTVLLGATADMYAYRYFYIIKDSEWFDNLENTEIGALGPNPGGEHATAPFIPLAETDSCGMYYVDVPNWDWAFLVKKRKGVAAKNYDDGNAILFRAAGYDNKKMNMLYEIQGRNGTSRSIILYKDVQKPAPEYIFYRIPGDKAQNDFFFDNTYTQWPDIWVSLVKGCVSPDIDIKDYNLKEHNAFTFKLTKEYLFDIYVQYNVLGFENSPNFGTLSFFNFDPTGREFIEPENGEEAVLGVKQTKWQGTHSRDIIVVPQTKDENGKWTAKIDTINFSQWNNGYSYPLESPYADYAYRPRKMVITADHSPIITEDEVTVHLTLETGPFGKEENPFYVDYDDPTIPEDQRNEDIHWLRTMIDMNKKSPRYLEKGWCYIPVEGEPLWYHDCGKTITATIKKEDLPVSFIAVRMADMNVNYYASSNVITFDDCFPQQVTLVSDPATADQKLCKGDVMTEAEYKVAGDKTESIGWQVKPDGTSWITVNKSADAMSATATGTPDAVGDYTVKFYGVSADTEACASDTLTLKVSSISSPDAPKVDW